MVVDSEISEPCFTSGIDLVADECGGKRSIAVRPGDVVDALHCRDDDLRGKDHPVPHAAHPTVDHRTVLRTVAPDQVVD